MKDFFEYKEVKNKNKNIFLFLIIFFVMFCAMPSLSALANEENANNKAQGKDEIKFLEFATHELLPKQVPGFTTIKDNYSMFYYSVQNQLPKNAYLLDVYIPEAFKKSVEAEQYVNITRVVYFYTMPFVLHQRSRLHKLQLSFATQAMESIFREYTSVVLPTLETKFEWESNVYNLFTVGESVYLKYPKRDDDETYKYSMLQTFPMSDGHYAGAFLSTHAFTRNRQIYFISVSTFLTDNNYYDELMWTRNTLDKFIKLLPEEIAEVIE